MAGRKPIKRYGLVLLMMLSLWLLYTTVLVSAHSTKVHLAPGGHVIISEFMASNESTLADEDGDYPDWIEIHNNDSTLVNLDGWYLTDDEDELTKWQFPPTTLAADGYLVVFAVGRGRPPELHEGVELHTNFKLESSGEYLALVEPDGTTIAWEYAPEYPPQFDDVSYGLDAALNERYFTVPTPGELNGSNAADLGPIIGNANHTPSLPTTDDAIIVAVTVKESLDPVGDVMLHYRVMYSTESTVPMFDDGAHGDGAAGDDIYGATIASSVYKPGEMVRYYITAADTVGHTSRWPLFQDPTNSPEYLGTMIADESVTSAQPILHWFVEEPVAATTESGTRASLFYAGIFYDNLFVRRRGNYSAIFPKKSFKFDFNQGHEFHFSPDEQEVEEFNLNTTQGDWSYIRRPLAWGTYRHVGIPYSIAFPMRVQQNGTFYSVAIFVEQPDEQYLERQGLGNGALYKMFNPLSSATSEVEKKTRLDEDHSDLQALIDGLQLTGTARENYLFDHVNIPAVINYLAASTIMTNWDSVPKNYYSYRDTEGTGEWTVLPWDKDHTFEGQFANDQSYGHPLFGDSDHPITYNGQTYYWNRFTDALYDTPLTQEMYLRRLRTLMDELLQPADTPLAERYYEPRLDKLFTQLKADVALDAAAWETLQPFAEAIDSIKNDYLTPRRVHLYDTYGPSGEGLIPGAQLATATVNFGTIEFNPASDNQDEEYFTLLNPQSVAVDISGWQIKGDINYTFQPAVVIPAGGTLYVSPNVVAFRNRATTPTGGEGHFVQGNYSGQLSNISGVLTLYNSQGTLVNETTFDLPASPLAGQLIITELNYNPPEAPNEGPGGEGATRHPVPSSGATDGDDFEFIELKNITNSTQELGGVHFTDGISYTFPATATLAPSQILVLVRNETAFAQRYPGVADAGLYDGKLSNGGETVTLIDKDGFVITSFEYDNQLPWPESPAGNGYTLVRRSPPADPNSPCHWRASTNLYGSPSMDDPLGGLAACPEIYLPVVLSDAQ